jgi:hypothetical protein
LKLKSYQGRRYLKRIAGRLPIYLWHLSIIEQNFVLLYSLHLKQISECHCNFFLFIPGDQQRNQELRSIFQENLPSSNDKKRLSSSIILVSNILKRIPCSSTSYKITFIWIVGLNSEVEL